MDASPGFPGYGGAKANEGRNPDIPGMKVVFPPQGILDSRGSWNARGSGPKCDGPADAAVFTGKLPGLLACLSFVHALSLAVGFSLVSVMSALWGVPDEFGEVRWSAGGQRGVGEPPMNGSVGGVCAGATGFSSGC